MEKVGFTDEAEAAVLTSAACGEDGDSRHREEGRCTEAATLNLVIGREQRGQGLIKGFGAECVR